MDAISRARLISQSTLGDISSKIHVKPNLNNQVAQGSKTTDDLLQFSLQTAEVEFQEYPTHKRGNPSTIAARNNSTLVEHRSVIQQQDQSLVISKSVRRKNKGVLVDYNSLSTLPNVRDSLSAAAKSQFKKNDPYQPHNNRSRVELSKKEM